VNIDEFVDNIVFMPRYGINGNDYGVSSREEAKEVLWDFERHLSGVAGLPLSELLVFQTTFPVKEEHRQLIADYLGFKGVV